jgi:hypothetical protein
MGPAGGLSGRPRSVTSPAARTPRIHNREEAFPLALVMMRCRAGACRTAQHFSTSCSPEERLSRQRAVKYSDCLPPANGEWSAPSAPDRRKLAKWVRCCRACGSVDTREEFSKLNLMGGSPALPAIRLALRRSATGHPVRRRDGYGEGDRRACATLSEPASRSPLCPSELRRSAGQSL